MVRLIKYAGAGALFVSAVTATNYPEKGYPEEDCEDETTSVTQPGYPISEVPTTTPHAYPTTSTTEYYCDIYTTSATT